VLRDAFITTAVRCAPPDNTPAPEEISRCLSHLDAELAALPDVYACVALGKIAFDTYLRLIAQRGLPIRPRPQFGHGVAHQLPNGQMLFGCYHPSRQNTNTGKLTPTMMDRVFTDVREVLAVREALGARQTRKVR
jgi:uracil-DNA glycosylase family 4